MTKHLFAVCGLILLSAVAPTTAKADSLDKFVFQTCEGGQSVCQPFQAFTNTYTWQAPASPTPTSFCGGGVPPSCFDITASVTANGTDFGPTTVQFVNNFIDAPTFSIPALTYGGGFFAIGGSFVSNLQPWTGPDSSPTFLPEPYTIGFEQYGFAIGTLTITSATSVPEPSLLLQTGAGLLIGFAAIAFWRKQPATPTAT